MKRSSLKDKMIKAILFDLYGTLICLEGESPYEELLRSIQNVEERACVKRIISTQEYPDQTYLTLYFQQASRFDIAYCEERIEEECRVASLFPDVRIVLDALQKSKMKLGLISNVSSPYKSPFYRLELSQYFDEVFFSCELGMKKPDSAIYETMLARLDVLPAQVLMIGDSRRNDVEAPRSMGINALHLDRANNTRDSIPTLHGILEYLSQ